MVTVILLCRTKYALLYLTFHNCHFKTDTRKFSAVNADNIIRLCVLLQFCAELNQGTLASIRKWKWPRGLWKSVVSEKPTGHTSKVWQQSLPALTSLFFPLDVMARTTAATLLSLRLVTKATSTNIRSTALKHPNLPNPNLRRLASKFDRSILTAGSVVCTD